MAKIDIDKNCCKGCYICINVCPKQVFKPSKKRNRYGTNMPMVQAEEACITCRMCERMCPDGAINVVKTQSKSPKEEAEEVKNEN